MRLVPIASDGWRFIIPLGIGGGFLLWLDRGWSVMLGAPLLLLALFCLFFFRDFDRRTTPDDLAIYSPGDGRILEVAAWDHPQFPGWRVIRIFLSVFDGHVQRSPVKGRVEKMEYQRGTFLDARDPRAHLQNEQNTVTLVSSHGKVFVKQIAGLIARRIVCWAREGGELRQGQRYGLIRFGSQVDVILPPNTDVTIDVNARVIGGETVLAKWKP